jgi:AcrR family transcriptional regulator
MQKHAEKELTRARILTGAGRTFRRDGYGGAGVDGLSKAAGVTSGAFYTHFKSKADAFREAVVLGMRELRDGVQHLRTEHASAWLTRFVDFYLGERRTCAAEESCALQSLTGEVARADAETKQAFEDELRALIDTTADGMSRDTAKARRQEAIVLLALLSGGVSLARAVNDPALSREIASALRAALLAREPKPAARSKKKR